MPPGGLWPLRIWRRSDAYGVSLRSAPALDFDSVPLQKAFSRTLPGAPHSFRRPFSHRSRIFCNVERSQGVSILRHESGSKSCPPLSGSGPRSASVRVVFLMSSLFSASFRVNLILASQLVRPKGPIVNFRVGSRNASSYAVYRHWAIDPDNSLKPARVLHRAPSEVTESRSVRGTSRERHQVASTH